MEGLVKASTSDVIKALTKRVAVLCEQRDELLAQVNKVVPSHNTNVIDFRMAELVQPFSGQADEDVNFFIEDLLSAADLGGWPDITLLQIAKFKLVGDAKTYVLYNEELRNATTFEQLRAGLVKRFHGQNSSRFFREQLITIKRNHDESLDSFVDRIRRITKNTYQLSGSDEVNKILLYEADQKALDAFLHGLDADLSYRVRSKFPETLDEALRLANQFEQIDTTIQAYEQSNFGKQAYYKGSNKEQRIKYLYCTFCHKNGHVYADCRSRVIRRDARRSYFNNQSNTQNSFQNSTGSSQHIDMISRPVVNRRNTATKGTWFQGHTQRHEMPNILHQQPVEVNSSSNLPKAVRDISVSKPANSFKPQCTKQESGWEFNIKVLEEWCNAAENRDISSDEELSVNVNVITETEHTSPSSNQAEIINVVDKQTDAIVSNEQTAAVVPSLVRNNDVLVNEISAQDEVEHCDLSEVTSCSQEENQSFTSAHIENQVVSEDAIVDVVSGNAINSQALTAPASLSHCTVNTVDNIYVSRSLGTNHNIFYNSALRELQRNVFGTSVINLCCRETDCVLKQKVKKPPDKSFLFCRSELLMCQDKAKFILWTHTVLLMNITVATTNSLWFGNVSIYVYILC